MKSKWNVGKYKNKYNITFAFVLKLAFILCTAWTVQKEGQLKVISDVSIYKL